MKNLLMVSAALAVLLGTPALAADMPVKAPPPPAPVWSWTGFYIGADAGYAWNQGTGGRTCVNPAGVAFGSGCTLNIENSIISQRGGLVGGEAGYNIQSGIFLAGIETDIQWSDIKASRHSSAGFPGEPDLLLSRKCQHGLVWHDTLPRWISADSEPSPLHHGRRDLRA
jgi:outer membrane immunogenic protein